MLTHKGSAPLETRRLRLRRFTKADAAQVNRSYACDKLVAEYVSWPMHTSMAMTESYLDMVVPEYEKPETYRWAIELDGDVIGCIDAIKVSTKHEYCEIGYCLGSRWWGRGIMTEALEAVIKYLFLEVGFNCICACHDTLNAASGRVMEKCGLIEEGVLRARKRTPEGEARDMRYMSILREEYVRSKGIGYF